MGLWAWAERVEFLATGMERAVKESVDDTGPRYPGVSQLCAGMAGGLVLGLWRSAWLFGSSVLGLEERKLRNRSRHGLVPPITPIMLHERIWLLDDVDLELRLARFEQLISRRPLLLNSVLLRQNPHHVHEWHKRVALHQGRPREVCDGAQPVPLCPIKLPWPNPVLTCVTFLL